MQLRSGATKTDDELFMSRFKKLSRKDTYSGDDHPEDWTPTAYRRDILSRHLKPETDAILRTSIEDWAKLCDSEDLCMMRRPPRATVDELETWDEWAARLASNEDGFVFVRSKGVAEQYKVDAKLNKKVCLYDGGVCDIACDALVNAANSGCLGGGGVDHAVHAGAGKLLLMECATFKGCKTGQSRLTKGYQLPAKYVIHTVGPIGEDPEALTSCYESILKLTERFSLRNIAVCMISTGIFGYPLEPATHIALKTVREWLETGNNADKVDRIIFACYQSHELAAYEEILPTYFPPAGEEIVCEMKSRSPSPEIPPRRHHRARRRHWDSISPDSDDFMQPCNAKRQRQDVECVDLDGDGDDTVATPPVDAPVKYCARTKVQCVDADEDTQPDDDATDPQSADETSNQHTNGKPVSTTTTKQEAVNNDDTAELDNNMQPVEAADNNGHPVTEGGK
eukprot:TRINITY_DN34200_c0_g1_i1.p1 TRINITY_DN34200_c0_g1~~TRINITY_DN34200_c0_g1_i1.p1  ORF type:complete len:453 (-),score=44.08 TRINITY_DN34200_c0_g1_i1:812-2170(-)